MSDTVFSQKRFIDLSRQAERKNIVMFSDFLTLNEQDILNDNVKSYDTDVQMSGGYHYSERQIAAFVPDALYYVWNYPITCLHIIPSYPKYADKLNHRDVLGAVMNLGIERSKIGDILVKDNDIYVFCKEEIADYITESLSKIKHTLISVSVMEESVSSDIYPEFQENQAIIASPRLDCVVAAMAHISRSEAVRLIQGGKVQIRGKECMNNSYECKENDRISIRSYGKFIFDNVLGVTRKDRIKVQYRKFV